VSIYDINHIFLSLEDDWDTNQTFWNMLNCKVESIKENSDVDDQEFEVKFNTSNFKLYRVNDARSNKPTIKHIADGPLKKSLLESSVILNSYKIINLLELYFRALFKKAFFLALKIREKSQAKKRRRKLQI
jgi:hypothetical protein